MELLIIKYIICGIAIIIMLIMIVVIAEFPSKTPSKTPPKIPPKATFFEKVNGKETSVEGPHEEQYLTYREKRLWHKQKKGEINEYK